MRRLFSASTSLLLALALAVPSLAGEFTVEKNEHGATVKLDGKLFTNYLTDNGPKPILWPVIGPTGEPMTRAYPMEKIEGEKQDHPHHRSIFFTHGSVNGVDFWSEGNGRGKIVEKKLLEAKGGKQAVIKGEYDWVDADGKPVCQEIRTYTFDAGQGWRSIDIDSTIKAAYGPVKFGETKEGSVGLRIPTVMDVTSKKGGKIVNSEGQTDADAWGKRARWVDYQGYLGGKQVGIAMLNHPSSFRYPTHWHVRTYGLFAANPFGGKDFDKSAAESGEHTVPEGGELKLRHRIILHEGDDKAAGLEAAFKAYADQK